MQEPTLIDIIILSYAKDEPRKQLTEQTIASLLASEDADEIKFNVVVIESDKSKKPFQFADTTTLYPDKSFGFHKYFNIGIKATQNRYIALCNNDLVFYKGWATELLKAMNNEPDLLCAHPTDPDNKLDDNFAGEDMYRDRYCGVLFGWCIFVKRELFDIIGPLDEKLAFWYSDDDLARTLRMHQLKNKLIKSSKVTHLGSGSWEVMDKKAHEKLTQFPRIYFNYKWHHRSYLKYVLQLGVYQVNKLFGR